MRNLPEKQLKMPVNIIVCLQLESAGSNIAQAQENKPQQRFTKQILDLLISPHHEKAHPDTYKPKYSPRTLQVDEADDVIELVPVPPPAKKMKQSSIADYFCKQFLVRDPVTTNKNYLQRVLSCFMSFCGILKLPIRILHKFPYS